MLSGYGQVQNTNLAQGLVMAVQSGMNTIPGSALTSGTLDSLGTYVIGNYVAGDDFTNIGGTNASGTTFKATGTTPTTWTNGSLLRKIDQSALTLPNPTFNLTNTGAVPTYGHKGNASYWEFDGVNDGITTPSQSLGTSDMSIVVRFKTTQSTEGAMACRETGGATNGFVLRMLSGKVQGKISSSTGISSVANVNDGLEHTVAYTADRDGLATLYVDGVSIATEDISSLAANAISTGTWQIGNENGAGAFFSGSISRVELFNYALSSSEVAYYSNPANHPKAADVDGSGNQATLVLSPEGMLSQSLWRDYYHSVDVSVGTGVTAPRLVKSWSGMNAWRFGGADSLNLADASAPQFSGDATVSFWFNPSVINASQYIFSNGKLQIGVNASDAKLKLTSDGSTTVYSASSSITADTWYHIVITRTSAGVANIYINGALSGTANQATGTPAEGTTNLRIGTDGSVYLTGIIEGFKAYDRILSSEQIASDYAIYQN